MKKNEPVSVLFECHSETGGRVGTNLQEWHVKKKRLAFSIHSEWSDSDMLWILEGKCKRISRTRPWYIHLLGFDTCVDYILPMQSVP